MSEIFDAIARISWDSNLKELKAVTDEMRDQDKVLDELRRKGGRLEEQIKKTNDPAKLARYNNELQETKRRADAIVTTQKKQVEITEQLRKKQSELHSELRKNNDPKLVQGLLQNLGRVENQLDVLTTKARGSGSMGSKIGGLGESLLMGFGIGGGMAIFDTALGAIRNFIGNASAEFEDAERAAIELERALGNIGKGNLLVGLQNEATQLAEKFGGLFDNDDIVKAQTQLVQYGKVSREELSKLLPVILELSSAQRVDLATATQTVINILEGRGGQTLRDYGVSVKGVKTEHDRLNVVLGDFATKLQGASDAYAMTAEGIERKNAVLMAATEERFGSSINKLRKKILPVITSFLEAVNLGLMSDEDIRREQISMTEQTFAGMVRGKSESELKAMEERAREYGSLAFKWKANIDALREKGSDEIGRIEYLKRLKEYNKEFDKATRNAIALNNAISGERAIQGADKGPSNKNADSAELKEPSIKTINDISGTAALAASMGTTMGWLLSLMFDPESADKLSESEQKIKSYLDTLQDEMSKLLDESNREQILGIEEVKGSTQLNEELMTYYKQKEEKKRTEIVKEEAKKRNRAYKEELFANTIRVADVTQDLISQEQDKNDRLIQLQQERIDNIRNSQEKGSKESLKVEEDRLNELLAKRRRYEQQQRVIDAAVIAANQAVAISGAIATIAKADNPILIAANVLAILAGIGATVAGIKGAFQDDTGFFVGGYTGDGDPRQTSTAVGRRPYKYHRGEFVMDHDLTNKHRDLFDGMHKRELMVQKLNDGYYVGPKVLDTDRAISDYHTAKNYTLDSTGVISELQTTNKLLRRGRVVVENNFDVKGFSTSLASQITQTEFRRKMTKLG